MIQQSYSIIILLKRPFKINFKTNEWFNVERFKQKQAEAEAEAQQQAIANADVESISKNSTLSSVPVSLFSTPRNDLMQYLPNIDLTLSAKIKQADVRNYLVEVFSQGKFHAKFFNSYLSSLCSYNFFQQCKDNQIGNFQNLVLLQARRLAIRPGRRLLEI